MVLSRRKGITPTYSIPDSSRVNLFIPPTTTIFLKKSPLFLNDNVSCSRFSAYACRLISTAFLRFKNN